MDTDKAYLLGLIIGGGVFGNAEDVLQIKLPFNKWGSYQNNPKRAGMIAKDILGNVGQMFRAVYGLSTQYETLPSGKWVILCEGDTTALKEDLRTYGIDCEGEIRGTADIERLIAALVDDNLKRRFVAGLADTIGSMAKSHRRFTDEHQVISFEIKGYNYKFVCDLCRLLYSINCIPDQINWNHPNIHSPSDPYYKQWNKGFKLRILLDQYAKFGALAFRTKAESPRENRQLQHSTHEAIKCEEKKISVTPSTVHFAENDSRLPLIIRGGHYIHFKHFCAVMGCEHAPYAALCPMLKHMGEIVFPFPILCKDTQENINCIIEQDSLMAERVYSTYDFSLASLLDTYSGNSAALLFGKGEKTGYPITEILKAAAYILANDDELNGKRPKGKYLDLLRNKLESDSGITIQMRVPDLLTPLILSNGVRAALIGAKNPDVYEKLIVKDKDNPYKISVRKITEEDLRNG